jgi:hypothetical protein
MQELFSSIPLPAAILLVIAAGVAAAALFWKAEDKLVEERKKCAELNALLSKYGYTLAASIFGSLEVGDVPGALKEVESLLKTLSNTTAGPALLQSDLLSQINAQLTMPGAAPAVLKAVAGYVANPANAAIVKAAGLAVIAAA